MVQLTIKLKPDFEILKQLVNKNVEYDELNIDVKQGRHIIDGKSFLGMLILNLKSEMTLLINSNEAEDVTKYIDDIEPFVLEKIEEKWI
mgnify:CR=1 FL=1